MKYIATIEPQAWINDVAIPVDPPGPTEWDCTDYATSDSRDIYLADLEHMAMALHNGGVVDLDDVFKYDPAAPDWVESWSGPFTIVIRTNP